MGGEKAANFQQSANLVFEQLDGELDAALIFAAAAEDAEHSGRPEFMETCRADAADAYSIVAARLEASLLSDAERCCVEVKLARLREWLEQPRRTRIAASDEAA